jgi:hypothetical protein
LNTPEQDAWLFACLQRLRLGFVAEPLIGVDGADYEITIRFGPQCSIACRWWSELPAKMGEAAGNHPDTGRRVRKGLSRNRSRMTKPEIMVHFQTGRV